tara:strand:+ start:145 stop:522 length:378 start_codon:yes stop_codon:yes gene_type:complete
MEQGMTTGRPAHMMSFADSVKGCMQKSFTMQGRASRSEYWFFVLFNILLSMGSLFAHPMIGLITFITLPASICVMVRRLHDLGKSGWWWLIAFIPLIGGLILLFWFVSEGEDGPNYYGEVPTNTI